MQNTTTMNKQNKQYINPIKYTTIQKQSKNRMHKIK